MSKASKKYWKENQQSITNIFDYAEAYHQSEVKELKEFAIWMTGCGYDFTQHEYFIQKRDELLRT